MRKSLFWRIHRFIELRGLYELTGKQQLNDPRCHISAALMADHQEAKRRGVA